MTVIAEKSEEFVLELGEFGLAGVAGVPFHIVIEKVDRLGFEKLTNLFVFMDDISEVDFIDFGVDCFISDSGPEEHPGEDGESLESESEVPELVEEERERWQDEHLERILISFATEVDSLEGGEDSVEDVLQIGVEGWSGDGRIFRFSDFGGLEVILEVGIVGRFPLVLPTDVVGIACGPANFVISDGLLQ